MSIIDRWPSSAFPLVAEAFCRCMWGCPGTGLDDIRSTIVPSALESCYLCGRNEHYLSALISCFHRQPSKGKRKPATVTVANDLNVALVLHRSRLSKERNKTDIHEQGESSQPIYGLSQSRSVVVVLSCPTFTIAYWTWSRSKSEWLPLRIDSKCITFSSTCLLQI